MFEPVERQVGVEARCSAAAARRERCSACPGRGLVARVARTGLHSVVSGVVALAEEAGVGPGPAERLAPAEPAGHVDVVGQVAAGRRLQVLAHRAHARRVGVARVLVGHRRFEAGVARQAVVAAGLVVDRADDRRPGASTAPSAAGARRSGCRARWWRSA